MGTSVRYKAQELPTVANGAKITSKAGKGSSGKTFSQATSTKQPTHKGVNQNSKLKEIYTTSAFDGGDMLALNSQNIFLNNEKWCWIFVFVDLDTTNDCALAYSGQAGGYLSIGAGGTSIKWRPDAGKLVIPQIVSINNTNNSTTSYTFGNDVEMLSVVKDGTTAHDLLKFYNIDGNLIGQSSAQKNSTVDFYLNGIGADSAISTSNGFKGNLIDAKFYQGSGAPTTSAAITLYGNKYKYYKD